MDSVESTPACPQCHQPVPPEWYFCANCGKNLKEKPPSTTVITQVGLYLLSVLLPPLGLWPGMKYIRSSYPLVRRVGIIIIILTVVSFVITIILFEQWLAGAVQEASSSTLGNFGGF